MIPLVIPIGGATILGGNSEEAAPTTDPLATIDAFTSSFTSLFQDHILNMASTFWSGYYSLFFVPLVLWLTYHGIRYMNGAIKGDVFRKEINRAGVILIFMVVGYTAVPIIEMVGDSINGFLTTTSNKYSGKVIQSIASENSTSLDLSADTPENRALLAAINKSDMAHYHVLYEMGQAAKTDHQTLSSKDVQTIETLKQEAGVELNSEDLNTSLFEKKAPLPDLSLTSFNIVDFMTYILMIVGACLKSLMLILRLFLVALMRFSFPIALSLSLIPTMEKTALTWLESYLTVVLLGVTITLISAISSMSCNIASVSNGIEVSFLAALIAFMSGIFYLLSPALTVMMFGGSQTVAQLPQQIYFAAMGLISMAKVFPHAAKVLKVGTDTPTQSTPNGPTAV